MRPRRGKKKGEDPEALIVGSSAGGAGAGRGTGVGVGVVTEREIGGTEIVKKRMREAGEETVIMTKKEAVKEKKRGRGLESGEVGVR